MRDFKDLRLIKALFVFKTCNYNSIKRAYVNVILLQAPMFWTDAIGESCNWKNVESRSSWNYFSVFWELFVHNKIIQCFIQF